jgi:hypothetical protein
LMFERMQPEQRREALDQWRRLREDPAGADGAPRRLKLQ